jgi:AcrR family transcriptional regulator
LETALTIPAASAVTIAKDAPAEPVSAKREAILAAATRVFLEHGYGAAGMGVIAAAAAVSKQTVYSHFGNKEALFGAIVRERCDRLLPPTRIAEGPRENPATVLTDVAVQFVSLILNPESRALFRAVVAESTRFPELAAAFYKSGPLRAVENLAVYLADADARGALRVEKPQLSARLFFGMLRGDWHLRLLLGVGPEPSRPETDAVVTHAVAAFLAAHRR